MENRYGRIWSNFLKNKYPVNMIVRIEKTEGCYIVTPEDKVGESLEPSKVEPSIIEIKEIQVSALDSYPSPPLSEQKIVMIDANNVAYWGLPEDPYSGHPKPSYDQIANAETHFLKQGYRVLMFADPSLIHFIDKKEELKKRERVKEIRVSPPDVEADVNILNVAIVSYPKALVVTNDKYDDHPELLNKFKEGGGSLLRFDTENKKFIPMNRG